MSHYFKCDNCRTPIMRFVHGVWTCLNCLLFAAIYTNRDDTERVRLLALADSTKQASINQRARERGMWVVEQGGAR